jgi:hypothetical protein
MNHGKFVFTQVAEFLPQRIFDRIVKKFSGNRYVKHFTCWNQLLCMMFGQLTGRDSLRDLLMSISPHTSKFYHLGFGKNVSRSNLANANEKRDYQIYEALAYELIATAQRICTKDPDFSIPVKGKVYAFDATIIDLCLNVFWWATFRRTKGAIKGHVLYDVQTSIPVFIHVTPASVHEVNGMDELSYEKDGFYVFDRGYFDYTRLFRINSNNAFFVIRAKKNAKFTRLYSNPCDKETGVLCDQIIVPEGYYPKKYYPEKLRRIKYRDPESGRVFVFITNNFILDAKDIAMLYKYRWKIELFFKWIKQHLKIKSFWGTTENAVKTQLFIAICTYVLVAIIKEKLKSDKSNYEILQILGIALLDKTPLKELITNQIYQDVKEQDYIQLKINLF